MHRIAVVIVVLSADRGFTRRPAAAASANGRDWCGSSENP